MPGYRHAKKFQCFSYLIFNSFDRNTEMTGYFRVGHLFLAVELEYHPAFLREGFNSCVKGYF